MGNPAIETKALAKHYQTDGVGVDAVRGVDLAVERGEFVAIVGPSGCGKSTLLYMLGALARPTGGSVRMGGRELADLGDRALARIRAVRVGFVFQRFNLLPALTAVGNIKLALKIAGRRRGAVERAGAALDRVGLADKAARRPTHLSQGEQQRVAIARAVAGEPDIILADEPTGNLDSDNARSVMDLFAELNAAGQTIVLVTHDSDAAACAGRTVRMRDGRIVER